MASSQVELPKRSAESLADAVEMAMARLGVPALSSQDAHNLFADVDDAAVDMALNAMRRRQLLLGEKYPYRIVGVGVRRDAASETSAYGALLLMSQREAPFRRNAAAMQDAATIFETLTCTAVRGLLGPKSAAIRFGWPSAEGRPREFPDAIRWLAERMGVAIGSAYRPPRRQDGGVDVVGWRPFGDEQPGFPILLVQCTLERDFVHKSADVDLRVWSGWLAFDADPMTALAIPHTVAKAEDWREMSARVIVLDRIRLTLLVDDEPPPEVAEWAMNEFAQLRSEVD